MAVAIVVCVDEALPCYYQLRSSAFLNAMSLIGGEIFERLPNATWPSNLDKLDSLERAQTEVGALIT